MATNISLTVNARTKIVSWAAVPTATYYQAAIYFIPISGQPENVVQIPGLTGPSVDLRNEDFSMVPPGATLKIQVGAFDAQNVVLAAGEENITSLVPINIPNRQQQNPGNPQNQQRGGRNQQQVNNPQGQQANVRLQNLAANVKVDDQQVVTFLARPLADPKCFLEIFTLNGRSKNYIFGPEEIEVVEIGMGNQTNEYSIDTKDLVGQLGPQIRPVYRIGLARKDGAPPEEGEYRIATPAAPPAPAATPGTQPVNLPPGTPVTQLANGNVVAQVPDPNATTTNTPAAGAQGPGSTAINQRTRFWNIAKWVVLAVIIGAILFFLLPKWAEWIGNQKGANAGTRSLSGLPLGNSLSSGTSSGGFEAVYNKDGTATVKMGGQVQNGGIAGNSNHTVIQNGIFLNGDVKGTGTSLVLPQGTVSGLPKKPTSERFLDKEINFTTCRDEYCYEDTLAAGESRVYHYPASGGWLVTTWSPDCPTIERLYNVNKDIDNPIWVKFEDRGDRYFYSVWVTGPPKRDITVRMRIHH